MLCTIIFFDLSLFGKHGNSLFMRVSWRFLLSKARMVHDSAFLFVNDECVVSAVGMAIGGQCRQICMRA
ncbi:hypothetical protein CBF45_08065 [Bordetella sp. J329]|nr:hypothetical protein CBF45_08065 [Bordetella sp. J329]